MNKITYKKIQLLLVLITILVLFFSFYLQYSLGLHPCPLCVMQRICIFLLLMFLGLSIGTLRKAHIVCLGQSIFACAGLFFSLRQLWLQSLPLGEAPACMPDLGILVRYFPFKEVVHTLFWGTGDCAEVNWSFLGISIPGWTALYFIFIAGVSLFLYMRTRKVELLRFKKTPL